MGRGLREGAKRSTASDILDPMHRRVVSPLVALAVAACGAPFTSATNDGGPSRGEDASTFDTGAPGPDATADDATSGGDASPEDATTHDAVAEEAGRGKDAGLIGDLDAGPVLPDTGICIRACPAGFDCIAGKCEDHADTHFSANNNRPFNWSYGFASDLGGMFQLDPSEWTAGTSLDVWTNTTAHSLLPSVFHNSGVMPETFSEMTVPAGTLGFYPGAGLVVSIVRWTAPVTGIYDIDVTFTGLSTPVTTVSVGVLINESTTPADGTLNDYGAGNTYTSSLLSQMLSAAAAVDFFVEIVPNRDDPPGGASLDVKITAE